VPPRPAAVSRSGAGLGRRGGQRARAVPAVRTLLVDLDDTLLDYSGGTEESWCEACEAAALPIGLDPAVLAATVARARRWFWDDPERHRRERVDMMAASLAEDFAARRWQRMRLFPGVVDALGRLRDGGVGLGLVTNGDRRQQRRKIEQHDLAKFFDVIVIEGEFGAGKPEEAVYRHALAALRARPDEAWMVGDHIEFDVGAPQRLGLRGVWVDGPGAGLPDPCEIVPHRVIRAFPELLADQK
jgi:putative hydrolase of the HAD superfamily